MTIAGRAAGEARNLISAFAASGSFDTLATPAENLKHEAAMRKNPDMEHDEPNGLRIAAKKSGEILWKFTTPGTFEYACLIPDHREYGMTGKVIVK